MSSSDDVIDIQNLTARTESRYKVPKIWKNSISGIVKCKSRDRALELAQDSMGVESLTRQFQF